MALMASEGLSDWIPDFATITDTTGEFGGPLGRVGRELVDEFIAVCG